MSEVIVRIKASENVLKIGYVFRRTRRLFGHMLDWTHTNEKFF